MLKVDFYESGKGDTIIISFPDDSIGIVDAHPSRVGSRPEISQLVKGKLIRFICLTHPHADHGLDLVPVLSDHSNQVSEFWHTVTDISQYVYSVTESKYFPSEVRVFSEEIAKQWANFHLDLWDCIDRRKKLDPPIVIRRLQAGYESQSICGVTVYFLSPEERLINSNIDHLKEQTRGPSAKKFDQNLLSAVLALEFGNQVVLLGADALQDNWNDVVGRYNRLGIAKALVLKVPHHGALNSIKLKCKKAKTYLDLCASGQFECHAVILAGDSDHPNSKVYDELKRRMNVYCTSNKRNLKSGSNSLNIEIPGARQIDSLPICQSQISFGISSNGDVNILSGGDCSSCPA